MIVNQKEFELFIGRDAIKQRVGELASTINQDYEGKSIVALAVLNGAFVFASDLIRQLDVSAEVTFVKLKSYSGLSSTGQVQTLIGLKHDLKDKHVLIVEDIIDTGKTMQELLKMVGEEGAASVKICTLLVKQDVFGHQYSLDYVGFGIPDRFVVGYGMDFDEKGRQLPDIYRIKD